MKTINLNDLYAAAFYMSWGAKLLNVNGSYPHSNFNFTYPWYMPIVKKIGWVNYKTFAKNRKMLKNYCMANKGFRFLEVAHT